MILSLNVYDNDDGNGDYYRVSGDRSKISLDEECFMCVGPASNKGH